VAKRAYSWKRFWCHPAGWVNLSDDGFLVDPDAEYGHVLNQDVVPWESISAAPCLILVGEPGIGKSTALRDEYDRTAAACGSTGDQVLWVDLRSYQTDQRLHESVFTSSTVGSWVAGPGRLHLFIDSMDEALMRINNIGPVLLNEFKELPVSRLNLRLACRTADWPRGLDSELANLWGEDNVNMYELTPLRRADVQVAAKANGLEPEAFILKVVRSKAVPLAIKPVTLDFLLNTLERHGAFPSTQVELYDQGCRLLCEDLRDLSPTRSASESTAGQRLAVASRIAAATMLCNRDAVWTDADRGDVPPEDIPIHELLGGKAVWQNEEIEAGENALRQGLNTGLFSSRGSPRLGWAHQTYAEFLAARFLGGNLTPSRIISLILHDDGKVIPQLHELAAWLVSIVPNLFRRLLKTDAEFLLRSDVATADFKDRQDLVENLLSLFDKGELLDFDSDQRRRYRKLNHPNLAHQLQPYIRDISKGIVVRRVAITIAEACEVQTIHDDLVHVSLDASDVYEVRVAAAFAILRIGDSTAKQAMRPLALGTTGPDPDDDLKGCGLACTWPAFLSATEMFEALTPEKRPNRLGLYRSFLRKEIADHVNPADIPKALNWAAESSGPSDPLNPLTEIADAIAAKALDHLNNPSVAQALARTINAWTTRTFDTNLAQESLFRAKLAADDERRRQLLTGILPLIADQVFELLYSYGGSLIVKNDFQWLLQRLHVVTSHSEQHTIIVLITRMYDYREPDQTDALLESCRKNRLVAREFPWLLNPVTLGSPEAEAMKAQWDKISELSARPEQPPLLDPPPQQRIAALLQKIADGDLDAFWLLNRDLTLNSNSTHYANEYEPDFTTLPGWKGADNLTRDRIIEAAKRYLLNYKLPESTQWVRTGRFPFAALAGYRALLVLAAVQPGFIENLPRACWERWASIVPAFPLFGENAFSVRHQYLTKLAYAHAPAIVLSALNDLIDKENEQPGMLFALQRVEPIWDGKLAVTLVEKLNDPTLKLPVWGTILSELLAHNVPEARFVARDCLKDPIPTDGEQRTRASQAAQALIRNTDDAGWDVVWPAVQKDNKFGVEVFTGIAQVLEAFSATSAAKLTDYQLAELYIWTVRQAPYSKNDDNSEGWVSPIQSLGHWRDSVLTHLKSRGTVQACDGIRRAMVEYPELTWLKWHLREAEQTARRHSWTPLLPRELLAFAASADSRLVQNGTQLLDVLLESLHRLEVELQGVTPAAPDLWNEVAKSRYRPKDEMRLSDYVKRYFERDIRDRGIIVNREVQIRQGSGNRPGEQTDIHVDATSQLPGGKYDRHSAIVEVKGCWNKDLMIAMQTQLRDRYLQDNPSPFGLYLVGWFMCPQWDLDDYRKHDTPQLTLDDARAHFELQAATLSSGEVLLRAFVLDTALR